MKPMTRWIRMAPSGKALLLPGSLAARKPILISQILPTVCSILARVRPEPIIARAPGAYSILCGCRAAIDQEARALWHRCQAAGGSL